MKSVNLVLLSSLHLSNVLVSARLAEPFVETLNAEHKNRRFLSGTSRYLKTSRSKNGSGLESDPYNDPEEAIKALQPGDTLYLMGSITNPSYNASYVFSGDVDDEHLWHSENTLAITKVIGTSDAPITITNYDDQTTVKGDGGTIVRVKDCEYLVIDGLNVKGEVKNIAIKTAKALQFVYREQGSHTSMYRIGDDLRNMEDEAARDELIKDEVLDVLGDVSRPSYTNTRGIYVSNSYHITISNCRVHHTPGGGIRVSYTEYVDIIDNEVHDTSRKSYSGTHALVVTYTSDDIDGNRSGQAQYRARIMGNLVHNNYNEIYSWAPGKTFIHTGIDEGKGISLQRNNVWNHGGRILVANNLAAYNGYSGVHSNDGDNIDFFSNTAFMNSYTTAVTYGYTKGGSRVGISLAGGNNCRIGNNIVVVDADTGGAPIVVTDDTTNVEVHTNIVWGTTRTNSELKLHLTEGERNIIVENPMLARPADGRYQLLSQVTAIDFAPDEGSPAIGAGKPRFATETDYYGHGRAGSNPTIGGIENPHQWHLENSS